AQGRERVEKIELGDGRRLFGADPAAYTRGRPEYPQALYEELRARCRLGADKRVFEIGPGPGLATRRLLALGIARLTAVEPDARLATYLRGAIEDTRLDIVELPFEDAPLPPAAFDLGAAATSFHWLEQSAALTKVFQALKPGAWWAMWWTVLGTRDRSDEFEDATRHLFADTPSTPSDVGRERMAFALDEAARFRDLAAAGFVNASIESFAWTETFDTARLLDLYGTFSPVGVLPEARRRAFLSELERIVDGRFGGRIERPSRAILYLARRPG
ncbi:MAG: class I SAM-dependent methyltransferase, partial [Steroidobacteraceae bacterium]